LDIETKTKIEQLLRQWLLASQGGSFGGGSHPMWAQAPRGKRAAPSVPLIGYEVIHTNAALSKMVAFEREFLYQHLSENAIVETKMRERKMARSTYYRWLEKVMNSFWVLYKNERQSIAKSRADAGVSG
jgi:hypothetical protein